jgi:tetratricopeptide (TPR) repeat protein
VYAADRLLEAGESEAVRDRHLTWYLDLAERATIGLRGADQGAWLPRLENQIDDLRAALRWATGARPDQALRLVAALNRMWSLRGSGKEARQAIQAVLATGATPGMARARALTIAGERAIWENDANDAVRLLSERLHADSVGEEADEPEDRGLALMYLSIAQSIMGATLEGRDLMTGAITLLRSSGEMWALALALNNSGYMSFLAGDHGPATRAQIEESLKIFETLGDRYSQLPALDSLAEVALADGDLEAARSSWGRALRISVNSGSSPINPEVTLATLEGLAQLAWADDQPDRTLRLLAAAEQVRAAAGFPGGLLWSGDAAEPLREKAERRVGDTAAGIWSEGAAMTLREAIHYALEGDEGIQLSGGVTDTGPGEPVAAAPRRQSSQSSRQRQQRQQD